MNFNKILIAFFVTLTISIISCSSDDENPVNEYPKTVNIKFEITTSNNPEATVTTTINNDSNSEEISGFPYSQAFTQQEINIGSYLKLTLEDMSDCPVISDPQNPGTNNCDYTAELSILIDEEVIKTESFELTTGVGTVLIDYTVE